MKLKQTVWDSLAAAEEEQARRCMAVTWKRATAGGSGGSGGMTGERDSSGAFKHGDGSGSGGGRRHDRGVVIIMAMERSRAASVGGGKSGVAVAGEIHRRRLGKRV